MNRASILLRLGEVRQAASASLEAMRRAQRLEEDKPLMPAHAVSYSIILNRLGRTDEAMNLLAAASRQLHAAGNQSWALSADYHLARSLMLSGRHEEALVHLEEVRRAWSLNATANHDRLAELTRTLAELELARGRIKSAKDLIDASLAQFGYPSAQPALGLTAALTAAARIYSGMGQQREAESFAVAAMRISEAIAREPNQSADVGEALLVLAALRRAQGDRVGAQAHVDRAIEALSNSFGRDHALTREALAMQTELTTAARADQLQR